MDMRSNVTCIDPGVDFGECGQLARSFGRMPEPGSGRSSSSASSVRFTSGSLMPARPSRG
jgi:hypothetical protein